MTLLTKTSNGREVPLTQEEIDEFNQREIDFAIELEARKTTQYQRDREKDYNESGSKIQDMIVAMWEKVIENRPESANAIQEKRLVIKDKYPKPT